MANGGITCVFVAVVSVIFVVLTEFVETAWFNKIKKLKQKDFIDSKGKLRAVVTHIIKELL